jgi:hypothetical protein
LFEFLEQQQGKCRPFIVEGYQVGLVRPDVMLQLLRYPDVFHVQPDSVELNPAFRDYDERSSKVEAVLRECRSNNIFITLKGWREEASTSFHVIMSHYVVIVYFRVCLSKICKYLVLSVSHSIPATFTSRKEQSTTTCYWIVIT